MELSDRVAIVTGGARGIGAACADALARRGAAIVLTDILSELGERTAACLRATGHRAVFRRHDVSEPAGWDDVVQYTLGQFGRLDILVNNAGINLPKTIEDVTVEEFQRVIDVNLIGCFLGMQRAIAQMKRTGKGAIVNIASNATQNVVPLTAAYSPTKAAVANLTKVAAVHCATERYGIRVNSVHPGPIATDMLTGGAAKATDIPQVRQLIGAIPLGRMGEPAEIGEVVAFLASDSASFMTGAEIFVDGALTISMMK